MKQLSEVWEGDDVYGFFQVRRAPFPRHIPASTCETTAAGTDPIASDAAILSHTIAALSRNSCSLTQWLLSHAIAALSRNSCSLTQWLLSHAMAALSRNGCSLTHWLLSLTQWLLSHAMAALARNS